MIAIVQYGAGNTASVKNAVERLGYDSVITNDIDTIRSADKVILPGVGEAGSAMASLVSSGLDVVIPGLVQPVLGICLGMQLLCNTSEEGHAKCLGVFNAPVKKFPEGNIVPHMGWNSLYDVSDTLFKNLDNTHVYFVHSYFVPVCNETIATCNYIMPFSAAMRKNNFYATQFHPEKSGMIGKQIIKNFLVQ